MRRLLMIITTVLIFYFVSIQSAQAQMINYNRRNKSQLDSSKKFSKPKAIQYTSTRKDLAKQAQAKADPAVTNRVERLYDLNRDGFLQKDELKDFYKDVVSSVKNKGKFKVSSELLKNFDADNDGQISLYEINDISSQLN
ncbi:MAG: EF-hand domain-containing protein [Candidatus Omnitrophota bacterium]